MKLGGVEVKFGGPSIGGPSVKKNGGPSIEAVKKGEPR